MNPYARISAVRIQKILFNEQQYENVSVAVSDLIADIIHYCEFNKIPFEAALERGRDYHAADLSEGDEDES